MVSLNRHTLGQAESATDLRYRENLANLALIANNPSALPAYTSIYSGTASVQDQGQFGSTTTWPRGFNSEALNPQLNRQILQNWALDPIIHPEKLEAMRAACRWVIGGPEQLDEEAMSLLIRPEDAPPGTVMNE
jgi:hypothetical protein